MWRAPPAVLQPHPHSWIIAGLAATPSTLERSRLGSPSAKLTRLLRVRDIKIWSPPAGILSNAVAHSWFPVRPPVSSVWIAFLVLGRNAHLREQFWGQRDVTLRRCRRMMCGDWPKKVPLRLSWCDGWCGLLDHGGLMCSIISPRELLEACRGPFPAIYLLVTSLLSCKQERDNNNNDNNTNSVLRRRLF